MSQSVTLTGRDVSHETISGAHDLTIGLGFPNGNGTGLTSDFFNFEKTSETVNITTGSVVEIYTGEVVVSLGVYA